MSSPRRNRPVWAYGWYLYGCCFTYNRYNRAFITVQYFLNYICTVLSFANMFLHGPSNFFLRDPSLFLSRTIDVYSPGYSVYTTDHFNVTTYSPRLLVISCLSGSFEQYRPDCLAAVLSILLTRFASLHTFLQH